MQKDGIDRERQWMKRNEVDVEKIEVHIQGDQLIIVWGRTVTREVTSSQDYRIEAKPWCRKRSDVNNQKWLS